MRWTALAAASVLALAGCGNDEQAVKNGATVKVAVDLTALSVASACSEYTQLIA